VGRLLRLEGGSAVTTAADPLQRSPVGIVNIFYCLRFETSLFVASYDSQGYGGGIRPRLHTGAPSPYIQSQSQIHIANDGQSLSQSWCRAQSGAHYLIFITI
jgi:hypothetical protein